MADFTASQLANMARQLFANGDLPGAEGLARRGTGLDPGVETAWQVLAQVSLARGDIDAAQAYISRALPLGKREEGELRRELLQGEVARRRTIAEARPGDAVAWFELGRVLQELRDMNAAQAAYGKALAIQPGYVAAKNNLGLALAECGEAAAGVAQLRQAMGMAREAEAAGVGSNLLYTMHFEEGVTGGELLAAHREWDARFAAGLAERRGPAFERAIGGGRRLKVGYVSAHFHRHSVGRFLLKLFENHDHEAVEVRCYSGGTKRDAVTARLRAAADGWVETSGVADAELAEMIRADGVEVLVDLTMHMAGSRLGVFARRAAPVQVTYLAYCSTTGLSEMDFRLTDAALDPVREGRVFRAEFVGTWSVLVF